MISRLRRNSGRIWLFGLFSRLFLAAVPIQAADTVEALLVELRAEAPSLDQQVLRSALEASECAEDRELADTSILTVIDYSLPSTEPRLWVLDLDKQKLLFKELVSHGVNTGENFATRFSNKVGSRQSSLGLFRTEGTYYGRNGFSLRLGRAGTRASTTRPWTAPSSCTGRGMSAKRSPPSMAGSVAAGGAQPSRKMSLPKSSRPSRMAACCSSTTRNSSGGHGPSS